MWTLCYIVTASATPTAARLVRRVDDPGHAQRVPPVTRAPPPRLALRPRRPRAPTHAPSAPHAPAVLGWTLLCGTFRLLAATSDWTLHSLVLALVTRASIIGDDPRGCSVVTAVTKLSRIRDNEDYSLVLARSLKSVCGPPEPMCSAVETTQTITSLINIDTKDSLVLAASRETICASPKGRLCDTTILSSRRFEPPPWLRYVPIRCESSLMFVGECTPSCYYSPSLLNRYYSENTS